ncbi:MAG: hypothetical protein CMN02_09265 [Roseibacillus sp.]|nr:hypothetical protein [Roseibacillus sp.]|tara:strand:- start:279 stop:1310 length:1032 start_codon:yes stop_codon:yes gene_type:complete
MKHYLASLLAFWPSFLQASPEEYVNFVRQIQQDSGVEWDMGIGSSGVKISPTGVSSAGSFFELWAIHDQSITEYRLDEQYVTAYTPNAAITILTGDPYRAVARTRVDQPFQVHISVRGLIDENDPNYATAPDAAKWVDYTNYAFAYPQGVYSFEGIKNPVGTVVAEGYMEQTANTTVTFSATNLTGPDLTRVSGEEVFTITAQADFGVSATILDSEKVQIWPIATGEITGLTPSRYYEEVPPVSINLENLYPDSTTYLRVYEGPRREFPGKTKTVNSSYVIIEDSIPRNRDLTVKGIDQYFTEEGLHTIELLHRTPFGTDLLDSAEVNVDRTIEINGGVVVQE